MHVGTISVMSRKCEAEDAGMLYPVAETSVMFVRNEEATLTQTAPNWKSRWP